MPWDDVRMPLDVDDWLMPVAMCLTKIQNEANASSSKGPAQFSQGQVSQYRDDY